MNELKSETIQLVQIPFGGDVIETELHLPAKPVGVAVLPLDCAGGYQSPKSRIVARLLRERGFGTLLMDCTAGGPDGWPPRTSAELPRTAERWLHVLAHRIETVAKWLTEVAALSDLPMGYLGSGCGADAALLSAAYRPDLVKAVVAKGGCSTRVRADLHRVRVPTLFVIGARDGRVVGSSREALDLVGTSEKELKVVPGASCEFTEPGTLAAASLHAANWFGRHLALSDSAVVRVLRGATGDDGKRGLP